SRILLAGIFMVASLVKFTLIVIGWGCLAAYVGAGCIADRGLPSSREGVSVLFFLVSPALAYLPYNPSFSRLYGFCAAGIQLSSGYAAAMSTNGLNMQQYLLVALLAFCLFGLAFYLLWRRAVQFPVLALILTSFYFAFRHGTVRADGHIIALF